jgi:hypothetical protein
MYFDRVHALKVNVDKFNTLCSVGKCDGRLNKRSVLNNPLLNRVCDDVLYCYYELQSKWTSYVNTDRKKLNLQSPKVKSS